MATTLAPAPRRAAGAGRRCCKPTYISHAGVRKMTVCVLRRNHLGPCSPVADDQKRRD